MYNDFVLFVNKNTGFGLVKLLVENGIYPKLVVTQTPDDFLIFENKIKNFPRRLKLFLSKIVKRKIYLEIYDVYYFCKRNKIDVISEKYIDSSVLINKCKEHGTKAGFIFTFGKIIKKNLIDILPEGIINFHPSFLPSHRGADPAFWTIYNGDEFSGITFHFINEKIDKGQILFRKKYILEESETVESLNEKLLKMGCEELLYFLKNGKFNLSEDDTQGVEIRESFEPQIKKDFFLIDENTTFDKIKRLFKSTFSTVKPFLMINNIKIEFRNYEECIGEVIEDSKKFVLDDNIDFIKINTSDKKILKLLK